MAADYESKASYSNKFHYFKYLSSYDSNENLFKGISSLKFKFYTISFGNIS